MPPDSDVSSSSDSAELLCDQIVKMLKKSAFDNGQDFLPEGCIDKLIVEKAVVEVLTTVDSDGETDYGSGLAPDRDLVEFILTGSAKKIFAITILAGLRAKKLQRAMIQFKNNSFVDDRLPVTAKMLQEPFFKKSPWHAAYKKQFCKNQWEFLAPVFSNENSNVELHEHAILPFIRKEDDVKSGAFGEVHQVAIHPSHQIDPVWTVSVLPRNFEA